MKKEKDSIQLFCIPYAGGSATMYNSWKKYLDKKIILMPIELAGKGLRLKENMYDSFGEAVEDLYKYITINISCSNYAIFGHSMGSALAYELAKKITYNNIQLPSHLFLSGRNAPHKSNKNLKLHKLSNEKLTIELLKLGGLPPDLTDNQDFIDYYLPIVRRDLKLIENYKFNKNVNPLNIVFTILSGTNDQSTSKSGILGWKNLSLKSCEFNTINGNHFFVHNKIEDVMNIINKTLL